MSLNSPRRWMIGRGFFYAFALLLAIPTLSSVAHAGEGGRAGFFKKIRELDLSAEQKTKLKEIRKKYREQNKKMREEARTAREKLIEVAQTSAPNSELQSLFAAAQEKHQAAAKQAFTEALEIRDLLTPEQRKKAGALMAEHHKKRYEEKKEKKTKDEEDEE